MQRSPRDRSRALEAPAGRARAGDRMTRRRATERAATIALVLALSGCVSRGAALSREELVGDWGLSGSDWALRLAADGTLANATSAEFDDPWVTGRWRLAGDVLTVEFRG